MTPQTGSTKRRASKNSAANGNGIHVPPRQNQRLAGSSESAAKRRVRKPRKFGLQTLGDVTDMVSEPCGILLTCGTAQVRVTVERRGIVRIRMAPEGAFGRDHSWAVMPSDEQPPAHQIVEKADTITLKTELMHLRIDRVPCRFTFTTPDGAAITADDANGMSWDGPAVASGRTLRSDERFFGLGEKGLPFNKRETCTINWNHDAAEHEPWSDPLYQTHPFVISVNEQHCYGLFFDNTWRSWFDLGKTQRDRVTIGADGGELNYYVIPGPTTADVIQRYTALVGTNPLPPLWTLGYQQCRWSYETGSRIKRITTKFRKQRIPCDVIYFDIDYMDGFRCFTWDDKAFPNHRRLLKQLAADGFKAITILDPGIKVDRKYDVYETGRRGKHYCNAADGTPYVGTVWPGKVNYPDFTQASTRDWWGQWYKGLLDDGVSGFWNDMNEPSDFSHADKTIPLDVQFDNDGEPADHRACHNVYGMQMARATHDGVANLRPGERPFVLTRAGYSGTPRYAAHWTGDNASTWEHLQMSIPMMLNLGLSGVAFIGADIGGFRGVCTGELFARWMQLGIFYPLCRVHTGGGPEQDPTAYGEAFERINRKTIELRYELLPYLYTAMRDHAATGLPVMRPLLLDFPAEAALRDRAHEFMFGANLFVAPVVHPGATKRKLRLPIGQWLDFHTAARHVGGEEIEVNAPIEHIPMFVRAGAVIPMRAAVQHVDEKPLDELILRVFVPGGQRGAGKGAAKSAPVISQWYHDDGRTYGYRDGAYVNESYRVETRGSAVTISVDSREGDARFLPQRYLLNVLGLERTPKKVASSGNALPRRKTAADLKRTGEGWHFDAKSKQLTIRRAALPVGTAVRITL